MCVKIFRDHNIQPGTIKHIFLYLNANTFRSNMIKYITYPVSFIPHFRNPRTLKNASYALAKKKGTKGTSKSLRLLYNGTYGFKFQLQYYALVSATALRLQLCPISCIFPPAVVCSCGTGSHARK